MNKKHTFAPTDQTDIPYNLNDEAAVLDFWNKAVPHQGIEDYRAKRGRPRKATHERKEQIALRIDADVLAWYRSLGAGWQTKMNAVLKEYRDTQGGN